MNIKKIFFITLAVLALPGVSLAEATIQGMVDGAVRTTFYIAGGVVVILWLVTGMLFLTAAGSPENLGAGKKALFAAIAGTVLCIIAGGAVGLVSSMFNL